MTEEEINLLYMRLAFQYEATIDMLLVKGLIDNDLVAAARKNSMVYWVRKNYGHPKKSGTIMELYGYIRRMICHDSNL
jgi:hypothetical protein